MKTQKFKELYFFHPKSTIKAGEGLNDGKFPFYTSSERLTKWINSSQFNTRALIFGTGGQASVHFADGKFSVSTDCLIASSKQENVNIKFVYYYLSGNIYILERGFKGAGLKHISKKYIENIDIPILPLETQNKIVAILDKANILIENREYSLQLLDELLRAKFLDIFGDPVINPKKWPLVSFSNIGEFKSGGTPSKENSLYWIGSFPWISPKDMKRDYINDSIDHISDIVFQKTSLKKIDPKSILIVIRGMILAHSFPVAINNVPVAINQDMKAIIPSPKYKSEYLLICLKLMKNLILQYVSTAAHGTKKINADSLRKIMIPCPQLSIQIEFIKLTHKLGIIRLELEKERNQIKNLFDSIVQKVFKGELSFNIDFELDALLKEVDFNKIKSDKVYLQRLVDRLKEQEFQNKEIYDTAKTILFKLLKEGDLVTQEYNDTLKSISLVS